MDLMAGCCYGIFFYLSVSGVQQTGGREVAVAFQTFSHYNCLIDFDKADCMLPKQH